jgi:hypothetical protein
MECGDVSGGGFRIEMLGKQDVTVLNGFIRHRIGTSDSLFLRKEFKS